MTEIPVISLDVEDVAIQRQLVELQERIGNLYEPMVNIGEYLLLSTDTNFEEERSPDGVPWRPLSARTLQLKMENRRILQILQSTGRLRGSITYRADPESVIVGTNLAYAVDHQLGANRVAARPFLGVSEGDQEVILGIIEDYLIAA